MFQMIRDMCITPSFLGSKGILNNADSKTDMIRCFSYYVTAKHQIIKLKTILHLKYM